MPESHIGLPGGLVSNMPEYHSNLPRGLVSNTPESHCSLTVGLQVKCLSLRVVFQVGF